MHGFWLAWFNLARLCMGLSVCVCRASSRACSRQVVGSGSLTTQHPHNTTPQTNTKAGVGRLTTQHNTPKQESDVYTETGEVVSEHPHPHNTTQHHKPQTTQESDVTHTHTTQKTQESDVSQKTHTHTTKAGVGRFRRDRGGGLREEEGPGGGRAHPRGPDGHGRTGMFFFRICCIFCIYIWIVGRTGAQVCI